MSQIEKRIEINRIIENQLPEFVVSDFPKAAEFLKQYYISQEYQGGPIDLIENIDKYIKVSELTDLTNSVVLDSAVTSYATTIDVDLTKSPTGTQGFPETYGLLKIDDEIITYTAKTSSSFTR